MVGVAERQDTLAQAFDAFRRDAAFGTGALAAARGAAFDRFIARGFPTPRDEEWRFTNIAPIVAAKFQPPSGRAPVVDVTPFLFGGAIAYRIVLVNGVVVPELSAGSAPAGVTVRSLRDVKADAVTWDHPAGHAFADLNTAFFADAVVIEIAAKAVVVEPIHVLSMSVGGDRPVMASPRIVIIAHDQSQASIVESHVATGTVFSNAVTDVRVGAGAVVDHVKFQQQDASSFHIGQMFATLGRAANFKTHSIALGARIARTDIVSVLDGEGAECTLNGLYVAGGDSLVDTHTTIDHARAHCPSHEIYKGILTGRARAVFNGKIIVRQDAQKTNAKQTNKALLLTDDAQINAKPQLEIFADDVKCTHGAAIGQLDEDAMFYLRARGISTVDARNMLIHAFAGDVLGGVSIPAVRDAAMRRVEEILALDHVSVSAPNAV